MISNAVVHDIISRNADGILVVDQEGNIQFTNPSAETLFGKSTAELIGLPFGFPLVSGETTELDILNQNQRGFVIVEMRVVEIEWDSQRAFLASLRDITARKLAERELRQRERELQAFFDSSFDPIINLDQDGWCLDANPAACRLLNIPRESIRSLNILYAGTFRSEGSAFKRVWQRILEGHLKEGELELHLSEGRVRTLEFHAQVNFFPERHLLFLQDVTDQREAQAALQLRNRAIEASGSAIMIIDANKPNFPFIYVNPAFQNITGYVAQEVMGNDCRFLYGSNPNQKDNRKIDDALKQGRESTAVVECLRKDGVRYWAELQFSPIRTTSGQLTNIVCVLNDITARKYLEAEQIAKEKIQVALGKERELRELKDRFLSMMSHELRTPLALIQLAHDMLHQYGSKASAEERAQYLESIQLQVEHLTEIISDVMTVSRSDNGAHDFAPEIIDLITFCRTIVEEFQLSYHRTHSIHFEYSDPMIKAPVDRQLLRQALTNLLSNAIKYSPEGSLVQFNLYTNGTQAQIDVKDQGIGVDSEDLRLLFEPFHRGKNSGTIPGTGLGLTITRQAVKAHGGTITVTSELGNGSTFSVSLPIVAVIPSSVQ
jgi:PAS domain S-box-containing protein